VLLGLGGGRGLAEDLLLEALDRDLLGPQALELPRLCSTRRGILRQHRPPSPHPGTSCGTLHTPHETLLLTPDVIPLLQHLLRLLRRHGNGCKRTQHHAFAPIRSSPIRWPRGRHPYRIVIARGVILSDMERHHVSRHPFVMTR
jgi:hypothetical protein